MKKIISIFIITLFLITPLAISTNIIETTNKVNIANPYNGILRIYVTEINSRIDMYNDEPYHFALVDIPYTETLSLDYLEAYDVSLNWEGNIGPDNLMVMAAVFNPESEPQLTSVVMIYRCSSFPHFAISNFLCISNCRFTIN